MNTVRRIVLVLAVGALVALSAYGVAWSSRSGDAAAAGPRPTPVADRAPVVSDRAPRPAPAPRATPTPESAPTPTPAPAPEPAPEPELVPGPAILAPGDEGDEVRELQARLRQIDWFEQDVTGTYGEVTTAAVEGFQAKREIPVTGEVDRRTMDRLEAMTTEPTADELANRLGTNTPGALDARCSTGRVLCVDKSSRTLRWVVDGEVRLTVDVRFGSESTPTREGVFTVDRMHREWTSTIYHTAMPYAMFFSGGQAVHYSSDFAARGYDGASHGCVNVRDLDAIAGLFDQVRLGDQVVVYWS
ncbi:L,D-transpeptidase family protein [Nocardioides litoris]|uniref:L,D-transpeptidase family protein n=1 Tax=Nocardioides litoris TaxID=1926648 RepID=UPI00111DDE1B|nr:L,D-transpeptidase family protein [Nocardioides litoris]